MEILSKTSYYEFHPVLGYISLAAAIFFAIILVGLLIEGIKDSDPGPLLFAMFFALLVFFCYQGFSISLDREMVYEYKVKITDFNEVYKKGYEIIDQEGEIYTVTKNGK